MTTKESTKTRSFDGRRTACLCNRSQRTLPLKATVAPGGFDEAELLAVIEKLQQFNFDDYGVQTEKYITKLEVLQRKQLKPITRVHYLVTVDVNYNDSVAPFIASIRNLEGVEVRDKCN